MGDISARAQSDAFHVGQAKLPCVVQKLVNRFREEASRSTRSGQTAASKRRGPVDHTCQKTPCCESKMRAMSQAETQTLLIGLSLWFAAKSKRAAADDNSLHVLNVGNEPWSARAPRAV